MTVMGMGMLMMIMQMMTRTIHNDDDDDDDDSYLLVATMTVFWRCYKWWCMTTITMMKMNCLNIEGKIQWQWCMMMNFELRGWWWGSRWACWRAGIKEDHVRGRGPNWRRNLGGTYFDQYIFTLFVQSSTFSRPVALWIWRFLVILRIFIIMKNPKCFSNPATKFWPFHCCTWNKKRNWHCILDSDTMHSGRLQVGD